MLILSLSSLLERQNIYKTDSSELISFPVNTHIGVASDLKPVNLEYIKKLSNPEDNCLYHADIPKDENDDAIDIAILNSGQILCR